ncbi:nuclear transport factor 2 family protein [Anditalea andensis]|uniref:SnoaL-like domain-containing protein n=1 Tax=Anditalea andensis TaxID=1048983 RepID=A0A074KQQ8_9BACT|nr:nuclear transport factor 2 family protein [Anditalea andensis]KEO72281.1 hypothetical protein EL17_16145 [Anditalea andensis]
MESDKNVILKKFNKAFAEGDVDTILNYVSDNIIWNIKGDKLVKGKENFAVYIKEMATHESMGLTLGLPVINGSFAVLEGQMTSPSGNMYAFCDLYTFETEEGGEIKSLTSYVIEIPNS